MAKTATPSLEGARKLKLTVLNLQILGKLTAGPLTTTEIKDACQISMALACHNMNKLAGAELVTKGDDKKYTLTPAGKTAAKI